jgi:hypothetical protein
MLHLHRSLSRKRLILAATFLSILIFAYTPLSIPIYRIIEVKWLDSTIQISDKPERSRMLIVQHYLQNTAYDDLKDASLLGHARYAEMHGYRYKSDSTAYVDEDAYWGERTLNKIYALTRAIEEELARKEDEQVEWAMYGLVF